ncbi:epidermal differentiation protein starting with MTF motif 2 [Gallus gallus]|uniref:Epidermal differentiation protein n=1 Tax=Gallus gallus TaxID=9031 RepID=A0A8V0X7W7_CHICK|nr:epidermal differentiation protein starting with MTF motif 2 [Gallus gallus]
MTFCYQNQWEDSCYSPCSYRTCDWGSWGSPCGYRSYGWGSPCGYRGSWWLSGCRDWCPSYSSRWYSPWSTRCTRRYSVGSCSPCSSW